MNVISSLPPQELPLMEDPQMAKGHSLVDIFTPDFFFLNNNTVAHILYTE